MFTRFELLKTETQLGYLHYAPGGKGLPTDRNAPMAIDFMTKEFISINGFKDREYISFIQSFINISLCDQKSRPTYASSSK